MNGQCDDEQQEALGGLRMRTNLERRKTDQNGAAIAVSDMPRLDDEVDRLNEEVRALRWLAKRKEQEWDQVISLLKRKECHLERAERTRKIARKEVQAVAVNLLACRGDDVISEKSTVSVNPSAPKSVRGSVNSFNKTETAATNGNGSVCSTVTATKSSIVMVTSKSNKRSRLSSTDDDIVDQETEESAPICEGCNQKRSKFVCANCSERWYCSRDCQIKDWEIHSDSCSNGSQ